MGDRLRGRVVVVVGGGQTPGETIGNGRAASILYAREGARVIVVDRVARSAEHTVAMIRDEGGEARAHAADVTDATSCATIPEAAMSAYGALDVLHNNVGIGGGDQPATRVDEEVWQRIFDVNLAAMWRTCKVVIPVMRAAQHGVIVNISSIASICSTNTAAYQISKAGVNTLTQHLAMAVARHGIRVNAILPGLMNTPMAIEGISAARGIDRESLISERDAAVPLGNKMGTAWDVAYASLFLASDEAKFITGVLLPVDGGQSVRRG
ncbi:MAG: SDR family NAD(P)-dependent oxidoreductase [Ilumatobacteraceae bacterium]